VIVRALPKKSRPAHLFGCAIVASLLLPISSTQLSDAQTRQRRPPTLQPSASQAPSREGSIKGRVFDESGQPFSNIVVTVRPVNGEYETRREVVTDEDGNFNVESLSAKAYTVECEARGYVEDDSDGSSTHHLIGDTVTLRLRKGGAITGRVADESGARLVKASVGVYRVRDGEGRLLRSPQRWDNAETDDRGVYRAYGLEEGSYILVVERVGRYDDHELRNESPTYYPSATADGAREVMVQRGAEASRIDIIRRALRGHAVSGKSSGVTRKSSSDEAYVTLVHSKSGVTQASSWQGYEQKRAFTFYGVPDGDYYLIAQDEYDEPKAASQPLRVKVAGNDVTGLDLKLLPFGSIAGRVLMEPAPKSASRSDCKSKRPLTAEEIVVEALRVERDRDNDLVSMVFASKRSSLPDEKGNFVLERLSPGRYHVGMNLVSEDLYVRSITMAGRLQEQRNPPSTVGIKSGDNVKGLEVRVAEGAAGVRGRIVPSDAIVKPQSRLCVHLMPAERESADDAVRFFETDAKENGEFAFANIAPGRYWLLVRQSSDPSSERSASESAEAGSRAQLRRESEVAGNSLELQPCHRVINYVVRYAPESVRPSRKVASHTNLSGPLK